MTAHTAGVELSGVVMNAACSVAKTQDDVAALAATNISVVTVGSITLAQRDGNPVPRWYEGDGYALNSYGMPNEGGDFYRANLSTMKETVHAAAKRLSLSIAGFSTQEYVDLAKIADNAGVDFLELNLGCPNVAIDGKQKPIASFDVTTIEEIIIAVSEVTKVPLFLKLSPYSNPAELAKVAAVISATGKVAAVVTANTYANSFMLSDDNEPVLASTYGGMSGKALLPIALGQVRQFRLALADGIAVIGVGGIETARDVELFMAAGASAVQAATLIVRDGHAAINRLTEAA